MTKPSIFEKLRYVADNAKNDPNAPTYFGGMFRGYLAFDTSQKFHYRVGINTSTKHMPSKSYYSFQWLCVINCAVLYNLIFVIGRSVFWELENLFPIGWYVIDYSSDLVYLIDIFVRMHEGNPIIHILTIEFSCHREAIMQWCYCVFSRK